MLMPRLFGPLSIREMPLPRESSHYSSDLISRTVIRKLQSIGYWYSI